MKFKPLAKVPEWPASSAVIRAQACCMFLEEMMPRDLYLKVRKAVFQWDERNDPGYEESQKLTAAVNARWKRA